MSASDRERWDTRYLQGAGGGEVDPFLPRVENLLPEPGRALDLAGGCGRQSLWLARRGWSVTLADVSPVALERASESAREAGLELTTSVWDADGPSLPAGSYDLVLLCHFLDRSLYSRAFAALSPGGTLLVVHPTQRNLERNSRPSARFLLQEGELPGLLPTEGEVLHHEECWAGGRHEVRLLLRHP